MRTGLTRTQWDLLTFLVGYIDQHGYSPSFQEMADGIGMTSKSGVARIVANLEARGVVTRDAGRHRSLMVSEDATADVRAMVLARSVSRETAHETAPPVAPANVEAPSRERWAPNVIKGGLPDVDFVSPGPKKAGAA